MVNRGMTMQGLGAITVGVLMLIVVFTIIPVVGSQLDTAITISNHSYATGTITFSGNVSNGNLVNITSGTGVYRFEFNTTARSTIVCITDNCIPVNLTGTGDIMWNQSQFASGNLTTAINGNASVAALVTAANATSTTTLTAVTIGAFGNSIALSENGANTAVSGATLTGGSEGSQWNSNVNTNIPTATDFWESLGGILKVAGVVVIVGGFLQTFRGLRG